MHEPSAAVRIRNALKKILIVEDDQNIREVLGLLLETLEIPYAEVADGEEAIEYLKQNKIDVIITDFQMPKVDGVELLNWCRQKGLHFPVIFISANAQLIAREQVALQDCCATLMKKPLDLNALEGALEAAIQLVHHSKCVHAVDIGLSRY
jgi:CheY-like chemotaxis protein